MVFEAAEPEKNVCGILGCPEKGLVDVKDGLFLQGEPIAEVVTELGCDLSVADTGVLL